MPLAGKYGRIRVTSANVAYMNSWKARQRRERLDTTNFESAADTYNVYSEGLTGVVDSTFNVEGYADGTNIGVFAPTGTITCDFLFRKLLAIGYQGITCDVLGFEPGGQVRQLFTFSAELQSNGLVGIT